MICDRCLKVMSKTYWGKKQEVLCKCCAEMIKETSKETKEELICKVIDVLERDFERIINKVYEQHKQELQKQARQIEIKDDLIKRQDTKIEYLQEQMICPHCKRIIETKVTRNEI